MNRHSSGLDQAVSFLTPLGGAAAPSPAAVPWFPAVGAAIGACVGALWYWSTQAFGAPVGAAIALVTDLVLTGMLHMDGLADAADGLLPHVDAGDVFASASPDGRRDPVARSAAAARRLEIMSDPVTGAFGVVVVVAVALVRFTALASIATDLAGSVLLAGGLWCGSRSVMAGGLTVLPYARAEGGLASGFVPPGRESGNVPGAAPGMAEGISPRFRRDRSGGARSVVRVRNGWHVTVALVGLAASGAVLGLWELRNGLAAFGSGLVAGTAVLVLARRRVGGFTGDVLGAAGVILETAGLLAASAHWSGL